jgi:alpha-D-ribose 1-methylphosphonate 5-triphosphate diphosphatase
MEGNGRTLDRGRELCELVERLRNEGLVRHEVHVRCELPDKGSSDAVEEVLRSSRVGIVSVMDHTPGQGQFRDLEWFRRYWMQDRGAGESQVAAAIEEAQAIGYSLPLDRVERIAGAAAERGTLFASHDDDTPERVELLAEKGVSISEFPVNARSASRARELGLSVCMGAPNAVRGVSSGGNLCATEAVELGLVDALCSDYRPPSLLQAVFELARKRAVPLPAAVGLVTSGPARAAGLPDRGELREGARADLIVVGESLGLPAVTHTVVSGEVASARGGAPAHRARVDETDGRPTVERTVGQPAATCR